MPEKKFSGIFILKASLSAAADKSGLGVSQIQRINFPVFHFVKMAFTVYVLKSLSTGRWYTGQTEDLGRRLLEHNTGTGPGRYTLNRGPWVLIYHEEFPDRSGAMKREKYLKTGAGRDFIKRVLSEKK